MWTLSPVAPGWSIPRSICPQALKRFIIYYQQGWHMRYRNGSVCFTHYLMSLLSLSCAIKSFNVKKNKINKYDTHWTSFHHPTPIPSPWLCVCVSWFSDVPVWEWTAQRSWAFSQCWHKSRWPAALRPTQWQSKGAGGGGGQQVDNTAHVICCWLLYSCVIHRQRVCFRTEVITCRQTSV